MSTPSPLSQKITRTAAAGVLCALGAIAVPAIASAQGGFAWACSPSSASYTASSLCAPYAYNSRGGSVKITHTGAGNYTVDFAGLGGRTTAGGIVQVTPYGSDTRSCKVVNWNSFGTDFIVNVHCFLPSTGVGADSLFDISVDWMGE